MSTETIVHIYCDGTGCVEGISGFSITATEQFKKDDMGKRGWTVIEGEQKPVMEFCGIPLIEQADDYHFCPKCSTKLNKTHSEVKK